VTAPTASDAGQQDRWTLWFFRIVQVVGLAIIIEQLIVGQGKEDRPWILLIGLAMLLGAFGIQLGLRAVMRIGGQ
jgi:hypothetical protein